MTMCIVGEDAAEFEERARGVYELSPKQASFDDWLRAAAHGRDRRHRRRGRRAAAAARVARRRRRDAPAPAPRRPRQRRVDRTRDRACGRMIRPARPDEADTLLAIQREACVKAFAHIYPPEQYPFPDDDVREVWREALADPDVEALRRGGGRRGRSAASPSAASSCATSTSCRSVGAAASARRCTTSRSSACARAATREAKLWTLEENWNAPPLLREPRLDAERRDARRPVPAEPDRRRVREGALGRARRARSSRRRAACRASRGRRSEIASTASMPSVTRPNTVCLPSSHGHASAVTMKNCEPFVFGPAFAIASAPRSTLWSLNSSSNV